MVYDDVYVYVPLKSLDLLASNILTTLINARAELLTCTSEPAWTLILMICK